MSDLISRQDAIEAIEDESRNGHYSCFASYSDAQKFKQIVNELPSAQLRTQMSSADLISRQDAIAIATQEGAYGYISAEELAEMPSAQRKAEWIHYGTKWEYRFTCSLCNYHLTGHKTNFCPNCGARMEETE